MKEPNLNFNLRQKGIILVVIPLGIQLISAAFLTWFLYSTEQEGKKADHAREVTGEALLIAKYIYDAEFIIFRYLDHRMHELPGPTDLFGFEYDGKIKLISPHLDKLNEITKVPGSERKIVRKYIHCANNLIRITGEVRQSLDQNVPLNLGAFALGTTMAYSHGYLGTMSDLMEKLIELEKTNDLDEKVLAMREKAGYLIWLLVAFDIVAVVWLTIYFNKGTVSRLMVLMENTKLLSHQQTLKPALPGNDEIAALDRVFHEMAEAMDAARAREKELLEMKQQIMAMVSHDLRSPLTSLQFTLEMLKDSTYGQLTEQGATRVDASRNSVDRLIRMINDLLDLEKLEAGKLDIEVKDIPIQVVVQRSIEAVEAMAKAKELSIKFAETELEVRGDGDRLIQVIVNFLSNAVKFSPDKSEIKIETSQKEDMLELRVIDSGPGIPEEHRQQVFERYRQLEGKMKAKGTGLGLAISKLIIEMHGGRIGVDEAAGGGSSFWFRIPAASIDTEEIEEVQEGRV